mgnify:CR=1 FL=1
MSVLALCGGTAFSQSQLDAFKYSQTELNGTARYLGMGGAFGALGGDISAMNTNIEFVFGLREDRLAWFEGGQQPYEGEFR